jgi:hypothetical protein
MQAKYPLQDFFFPGNEEPHHCDSHIDCGAEDEQPAAQNLAADQELVKKMPPDECEQFCSIVGKVTGVILLSCLLKSRMGAQLHAGFLLHRLFHREQNLCFLSGVLVQGILALNWVGITYAATVDSKITQ